MDVARVDPSAVDESAIGFRLGPRLNASGRLHRADAGLELLLTEDRDRARAVARRARRGERRAARRGDADPVRGRGAGRGASRGQRAGARVRGLAPGRDRHRRVADRRAPPPARDPDRARRRGGQRLRPLDPGLRPARRAACERRSPAPLRRPPRRGGPDDRALGGGRVPRGVPRARGGGAHARGPRAGGPDRRRRPGRRAVAGPRRGAPAARAVRRRQPRASRCSSPPRRCRDPRALGEGRHVAFTLHAGGARSRCVAFGAGCSLPVEPGEPADAAVRLEIDRWNGAVSPRLVLRQAQPCRPRAIDVLGEPESFAAGLCRELERDLAAAPPRRSRGGPRSCATCAAPASPACSPTSWPSGEPVLAVTAHAPHRARALAAPRRRLRAHLLGRARGRPRPGGAVHARRRRRPTRPAAARPSVGGGLDAPGVGCA